MRIGLNTMLTATLTFGLAHGGACAATVFSADFNNGDVTGWSFSTDYTGVADIESVPSTAYPSLTLDGTKSLGVFIKVPPPTSLVPLFAAASKNILFLEPSTHLSFQALSVPCTGCTISWFVRLDGVPIASHASNGGVDNISLNWSVPSGNHMLMLGMSTTLALSGQFEAVFDNVLISNDRTSDVPLPGALSLFVSGLGMLSVLGWRRRRQRSAG